MNRLTEIKLHAVNIARVYEAADSETRAAGARWYPDAAALLTDVAHRCKVEPDAVIGAAAAISPGVNWALVPNYVRALARRERVSIPTYTKANVAKAQACLRGRDPLAVLGGPKVTAFYLCLTGRDERAVCVDGHAARVARAAPGAIRGEDARESRVTEYQYATIAEAYRLAADAYGIAPHAMQATTWLAWKGGAGRNYVIPF